MASLHLLHRAFGSLCLYTLVIMSSISSSLSSSKGLYLPWEPPSELFARISVLKKTLHARAIASLPALEASLKRGFFYYFHNLLLLGGTRKKRNPTILRC